MKHINKVSLEDYGKLVGCYGKLTGWLMCQQFDLPTWPEMYIIDGPIDVTSPDIIKIFGNEKLVCRADAPFGQGNTLPQGCNLNIYEINNYLKEIRKKARDGVILAFQNPTIQLLGKNIPRYECDGGVMIIFEKGYRILLEYVGKGYDVGDLTRGKAVHTSLSIPWDQVFENPKTLFHQITNSPGYFNISQKNYEISRIQRIEEAMVLCGIDKKHEIQQAIPQQIKHLDVSLFCKIYRECIEKIILRQENITDPIGLIMNVYEDKLCIFEVWQVKRSAY